MSTTFYKEPKPGVRGDATLDWAHATFSWNAAVGTWDNPGMADATAFTKETKPAALSITRESKPTTTFTKEAKP
ncbi:hypothetical protein KW797_00490 [Candidatus Parcubacteria bacterium]|nr:hypothetical protein [Candidatus Parcubacteria bacterium]